MTTGRINQVAIRTETSPKTLGRTRARSSQKPLTVADEAGTFRSLLHFCAFCTQQKGTNGEEHKTASPSTQRKQSFYATSFCVPSAIPKACCLNTTYKSAGCRNARQRTNARLTSNNTKHISDQRPSCSSISRKKLFHSYQQSGCTTKHLTNCFSSTPGRLQMKRGTVTLMNRAC